MQITDVLMTLHSCPIPKLLLEVNAREAVANRVERPASMSIKVTRPVKKK